MSEDNSNQSFGKWLREPQTLIGLSAILLSICGLFIALYEASIMRQHQRASVWPNIEIGPSFSSDQIGFHIRNTGIGPARINAAKATFKGETLQNWSELLSKITTNEENLSGVTLYRSYIKNNVLPPTSERQYIFRINLLNEKEINKSFFDKFGREAENGNINISLCYCSVYEQCWITTMYNVSDGGADLGSSPERIKSCENMENSDI